MEEQILTTSQVAMKPVTMGMSLLRKEYLGDRAFFNNQALSVQNYLKSVAASIAQAMTQGRQHIRFDLPEQVYLQARDEIAKTVTVAPASREQMVGGWSERLIGTDLWTALRSRLLELEHSSDPALSASAILLRYAVAMHLIYDMLPSGRSVKYREEGGDEIPNIPLPDGSMAESALEQMDSMESGENQDTPARGDLMVPYVEAARRFFLPQWVAFDENNTLLVKSLDEANACIASMQHYLSILHIAVGLSPYMVTDEVYQKKRYGMIGQLVNQGRAFANYQVEEIIRNIQQRATSHRLDRGLSLSLPYFNDQTLKLEEYDFVVIPVGRIMFVPAFVVLAVRDQAGKVAQDTRFSRSTRKQLLTEFSKFEKAFLR
jgi:hypothetical protein